MVTAQNRQQDLTWRVICKISAWMRKSRLHVGDYSGKVLEAGCMTTGNSSDTALHALSANSSYHRQAKYT